MYSRNMLRHARVAVRRSWMQLQRHSASTSTVFDDAALCGNKVFIRSLGCARNWVDSEVMLGTLLRHGYEPTLEPSDAHVIVVNTCAFLGAARKESRDTIRDMLSIRRDDCKLVVTGCMVNLHKDELLEEFPAIDHILGSGAIAQVVEALQSNQQLVSNSSKSFLEAGDVPRKIATPQHYAYLKIAEGCRKRCSFCIIPKIKGPLQSKSHEQILKELHALLATGAKEVIFIAQDLGDYGKDQHPEQPGEDYLTPLLQYLLRETKQHFWLRLLYLYPDEVTEDLLKLVRDDERVCRYFDMPIQHASDKVLRRMRRKTSRADVERTLGLIRNILPDAIVRTTLMVGFPGETEDDFQQLVDFVEEQNIDHVGIFQFSPESQSDAGRAKEQVSDATKLRRYKLLTGRQRSIARQKVKACIGKEMTVVVDAVMHREGSTGRTLICRHRGQAPDVDGVVLVHIDEASSDGEAVQSQILTESNTSKTTDEAITPKQKKTPNTLVGSRIQVEISGYDMNLNLLGHRLPSSS